MSAQINDGGLVGVGVKWRDRAEAWLSCADHLKQCWTDEEGEREQGRIVSDFCRKKYYECLDRYIDLKNTNVRRRSGDQPASPSALKPTDQPPAPDRSL